MNPLPLTRQPKVREFTIRQVRFLTPIREFWGVDFPSYEMYVETLRTLTSHSLL